MFKKILKSHRPIYQYALFLVLFSIGINAQAPTGYYDPAAGKAGAELKTALYNIIKGHTSYPYTHTETDVWDILKETDRDTSNSENVILLYTGRSVNAAQEYNSGNGWTREHVWAKIHGDFDEKPPAYTDAHHLRPADNSTNSDRNSRWFDYCSIPHYDDGIATGNYFSTTSWTWEPRDVVKGDIARMIFYMATRYEGENGEPDLEVIDYLPSDNNTKEPVHAKLSALLEWHEQDPVNDWERNRNDIIYTKYQHNRNPFIDRPEFVAWIWSDTTGPGEIANLFFSEYIEGGSYNKALEIYNGSSRSVNLTNYAILANYNNNPWYASHYSFPAGTVLEPGGVWVVMHDSSDENYHSVADELTTAAVVNYNGNDVRALVYIAEAETTFLDVIGLYNDSVSVNSWTVAGIAGGTVDHTLVRKSSIRQGNPDWLSSAGTDADDSEWIVYEKDTFDNLGTHVVDTVSAIGLCYAPETAGDYRLLPCYPNPFNPATTIRYDLHKATTVTLYVYDLRGTVVNTLVREKQQAGNYSVIWNGKDARQRSVSAGVYLYRMQTDDGFIRTGKMILLK